MFRLHDEVPVTLACACKAMIADNLAVNLIVNLIVNRDNE
jgi:hypothetical protein